MQVEVHYVDVWGEMVMINIVSYACTHEIYITCMDVHKSIWMNWCFCYQLEYIRTNTRGTSIKPRLGPRKGEQRKFRGNKLLYFLVSKLCGYYPINNTAPCEYTK